jgi:hypothetical protein
VVANVFLLPLLYYLCQFYIAPYKGVVKVAQRTLHRLVLPFRGTAFAYAHLLLPRSAGGPFTPLRDIWATNQSMLAATHNLEESDGRLTPAMGVEGHRFWPLTQARGRSMDDCMTTVGHAAFAAFRFLEDYADRKHGVLIDLTALPGRGAPQAAKRRKYLYTVLADRGYTGPRTDPKKPTSLDRRLARFLEGPRPGRFWRPQSAMASLHLTPAVWNAQIRLMFNALPFERRRADAHMHVTERPSPLTDSPFPCYFCGTGEDSVEHVYGECRVVRAARRLTAKTLGCALGWRTAWTSPSSPSPL